MDKRSLISEDRTTEPDNPDLIFKKFLLRFLERVMRIFKQKKIKINKCCQPTKLKLFKLKIIKYIKFKQPRLDGGSVPNCSGKEPGLNTNRGPAT